MEDEKLKDLLGDRGYIAKVNIELALYKLAESLGIPKKDILAGKYDLQFTETMIAIYKQFKVILGEENNE